MNSNILNYINSIKIQFKSIYNAEFDELAVGTHKFELNDFVVIDISDWSIDEINFVIEGALKGIEYYTLNFVQFDSKRNGFPFVSFLSIINIIEHNSKELVLYIKKIPSFNYDIKTFLEDKGYYQHFE